MPTVTQDDVTARVAEIIEEVRLYVHEDGGDLRLVGVEDGVVKVRMMGSCVACPNSIRTLKQGVERVIREDLPEIREVIAV